MAVHLHFDYNGGSLHFPVAAMFLLLLVCLQPQQRLDLQNRLVLVVVDSIEAKVLVVMVVVVAELLFVYIQGVPKPTSRPSQSYIIPNLKVLFLATER